MKERQTHLNPRRDAAGSGLVASRLSSKVAFFDLDRTILSLNSGRAWVSAEYRGGYISLSQLCKALWWLSRYKLGWAELEAPLRQAIRALTGTEERAMQERVSRFFTGLIPYIRPSALEAIHAHQISGARCVLITTSSIYLARHFAEHLGLDEVFATCFEVRAGRFTGAPSGPLCYGEGKLYAAKGYCAEHSISLDACSFYTDSISDLPLLKEVGQPYVVTPDRKLRRVASQRGWPILEW